MASRLAQAQESPEGREDPNETFLANILDPLQSFRNSSNDDSGRSNSLSRAIHGSQNDEEHAGTPAPTQTSELTESPAEELSPDTPASGEADEDGVIHCISAPDINSPGAAQRYRTETYVVTEELLDWLPAFGFNIHEINPVLQSGKILTVNEFIRFGNANKNAMVRQIRPTTARIYSDQIAQMMLTVDFLREYMAMAEYIDDADLCQKLTVEHLPADFDQDYYLAYVNNHLASVQEIIEKECDAQAAVLTETFSHGFHSEVLDLTVGSSSPEKSPSPSSLCITFLFNDLLD